MSVEKAILDQIGKASRGLDTAALLEAIIEQFGGTKLFAKELFTQYSSSPTGGMARTRMLEKVMWLYQIHTTNQKAVGKDEDLSDDELADVVKDLMKVHGQKVAKSS